MTQTIKLANDYEPFGLRVAGGLVAGKIHVSQRGQNAAIGTTPETLWPQGALYTWNAAAVLEITSTDNTADIAAGTGALTVLLEGVGSDGAALSETITLTGQTNADTTAAFWRINKMTVATAGSGGVNAGTIYASTGAQTTGTPDVATTIRCTIAAGDGESRCAFYTVPTGKVAYLTSVYAATAEVTNNVLVTLRSRVSATAPWLIKDAFVILNGTIRIPHDPPLIFAAQTDIELIGDAAASTVDAYGAFELLLVDI